MVMARFAGTCNHLHFREIAGLLPPHALLVLNDTKVIPARLHGSKVSGGSMELLLTRMVEVGHDAEGRSEVWEALAFACEFHSSFIFEVILG